MSDTYSADSKVAGGASVAPAAGAVIAAATGLMSGARYKVTVNTDMSGTIDTVNVANLLLQSGGVTIATLPSVAGMDPIIIDQLTLASGATDFTVKVGAAAFGAASIIAAVVSATRIG